VTEHNPLWDSVDIEKVKPLLYTCHVNEEHMEELKKFIRNVELIKKSQVKQQPKLLSKYVS
jgi:hypothetical protein